MIQNKIKKNVVLQRITIIAFFSIQFACNNAEYEQQTTQNIVAEEIESCVIAMIPHQGQNKTDLEIQKHQQRFIKKGNDIADLENLGWAYVNKAQNSFDPGFYTLAEQTVECMKSQQPNSLQALLLQGHVFHNLHRFKQAETLGIQLVSARGAWFDYGLLGDALMEQGELALATIAYQQMMDQNPGPQSYNRAANIRWLKGDVEGAIELLNLSVSSSNLNNSHMAWTVTQLADYQYQSGDIEISVKYLLALLGKQPNYAPALLLLGRIKLAQGAFDKAEQILTRAVQLNPLPQYHWALIEALSENEAMTPSRIELEKKLYKTGEAGDRRTFALYLASKTDETEKSVNLAEQELQERHDVFSLDTYAWTLRSNRQLKKAQEYSRKALAEGTRSARLLYHAGVIANEIGQLKQAELLLKQAKKLEHSLWPSERKHLNQVL